MMPACGRQPFHEGIRDPDPGIWHGAAPDVTNKGLPRRIRGALFAAMLLLPGLACAETFPVPSADPHAASWGERGSFTLHYFGALDDGSACPPSPNALKYALADEGGKLRYLVGFSLDQDIPPALRVPFEIGTFCSLNFEGAVRFLMHHGTQIRIRPTDIVSPVDPPFTPGERQESPQL